MPRVKQTDERRHDRTREDGDWVDHDLGWVPTDTPMELAELRALKRRYTRAAHRVVAASDALLPAGANTKDPETREKVWELIQAVDELAKLSGY